MPLPDLDLLRRLVAIDSTSARSNVPIAHELASYAEGTAASIEYLHAPNEEKANLLIRFGPEGDGGLILSGHMDAVPATETTWESDPFTLTERDDRYVGRGAADMKGFLAVAMNAAIDAAGTAESLRKPLYLLFTYDEEVGTLGARQFVQTWDRARPLPRCCIIGEPTSFRPVRAHKGHLKLRITTTGKSAHSGYPHLGDNAIEKARPVLDALAALRRELEAEPAEHAELFSDAPYVPLNIATIHGGTAVNIVPDRCAIEVGIRLLPGMSSEAMIDRVRRAYRPHTAGHDARQEAGESPAVQVLSDSPPMLLDKSSDLYQAVLPYAAPGPESVSFASDAGWLQSLGIDCLLFGPGAIEVAHRPNEFTPKDEFHRAGGILRELIARFCA
jgi:acetylornithine deacetylase